MLPPSRLRVAAINFLNPAPLMWDFEHPPRDTILVARYRVHYTQPSQCAAELEQGHADLGLIPIAALTPDFAIVPGCTIASLHQVRSIQLVLKLKGRTDPNEILARVQTIAADAASRSSLAYAQILFRKFIGTRPHFLPASADPLAMLRRADAALLIGDPALLALEARGNIEDQPGVGPCLWLDLANQWRTRTGLPWVAAVWAVRPESLTAITTRQIVEDLQISRDHGLANIDRLVEEWTPRIDLPPATIRHYLSRNIHYTLDTACISAIELFRRYAAEVGILPALPALRFL